MHTNRVFFTGETFGVYCKVDRALYNELHLARETGRSMKKALAHKVERLFTTKSQLRKKWGSEAHALADYGDFAGLKAYVEKHPEAVNKRANGELPIHVAAHFKHRQIVELLVEKGAKVNVFTHDSYRNTPLHEAFCNNDVPLIEYLLSKGADIYARNSNGETPLELASVSVAKQYFKHFDFMTWFNGALPIHDYVIYQPELARAILSKDCGINVPCPRYNHATALHLAAAKGRRQLAGELIAHGAQLDVQDASGKTPLHVALDKGKDSLVRLLMRSGARIDIKDQKGRTPLDLARQRYCFDEKERIEKRDNLQKIHPWKEEKVKDQEETKSFLMDNKTKDLYEIESSSLLRGKAILTSALAPFYLPVSMVRQVCAVAWDVARVAWEAFTEVVRRNLSLRALVITPIKELSASIAKRTWHVVSAPFYCLGVIFSGLYTQINENEGRKWMNRMADSWDESRFLSGLKMARVGNLNMTLNAGKRRFQL